MLVQTLDAGIESPRRLERADRRPLRHQTNGQAQVDVLRAISRTASRRRSADPEFIRSADEMGLDRLRPARSRLHRGGRVEFLGPDSLRPLAEGSWTSPTSPPFSLPTYPPKPLPDRSAADAPPGGTPSVAEGGVSAEPPLYTTEAGTDGYEFLGMPTARSTNGPP